MRNGFTLIELMIVVVIIGILAALAIPRFMAATEALDNWQYHVVKNLPVIHQEILNGSVTPTTTDKLIQYKIYPDSTGYTIVATNFNHDGQVKLSVTY